MFQGWRIKIREAEEAYRAGRLDDAGRLLAQGDLRDFLPGRRLSEKVAHGIAERARSRLLDGDTSAGWRDLESARNLGGETEALLSVRQEMVELALDEVITSLKSGDCAGAIGRIEKLERRHVSGEAFRKLREVARRMESARNLAHRGRYAEAESQLDLAATLRPDLTVLAQWKEGLGEKQSRARELTEQLHRALVSEDWSSVLTLADSMIQLAPEDPLALDARRRAWAKVGSDAVLPRRAGATQTWMPPRVKSLDSTARREGETALPADLGTRFVLWVDAVGGYLVCLSPEIVLGQAAPGNPIAVPILADVSRKHAKIRRQGEGYVLEPIGPVRVGGVAVHDATLLTDGDEILLGTAVRIRFCRPHVLSATARLEFLSRHKTLPSADGVLLMAESCVLGPHYRNHVVCRDWPDDVVLYRQDGNLFCRAMESIDIDGQLCDGRGRVGLDSHINGSGFSMSLEEVS